MADLPSAELTVDDEAGSFAGGTNVAVVVAPVAQNADTTPRFFASAQGVLDQHEYSQGASYVALHIEKTKKPVVFVGIPIATPGAVGRQNASGVSGSCAISVAAGPLGILEETEGILTVAVAGTIGVAGIEFDLSMDGGKSKKRIALGVASSYT